MGRVVIEFSLKCNISALFLSANVVNLPRVVVSRLSGGWADQCGQSTVHVHVHVHVYC